MGHLLLKIGQRRWMDELYHHGSLRLRPLAYYAKYDGNLVVGDPDDGLLARYPREDPSLKVTFQMGSEKLFIPDSSLRVFAKERRHGVYCMMGVETVKHENGAFDLFETLRPGLDNRRLLEFGDTVIVFRDTVEFTNRLTKAVCDAGHDLDHAPVSYLPLHRSGRMGPFAKVESYAYQREYRFLTSSPIGEHLDLRLGPLTDIAWQAEIAPRQMVA